MKGALSSGGFRPWLQHRLSSGEDLVVDDFSVRACARGRDHTARVEPGRLGSQGALLTPSGCAPPWICGPNQSSLPEGPPASIVTCRGPRFPHRSLRPQQTPWSSFPPTPPAPEQAPSWSISPGSYLSGSRGVKPPHGRQLLLSKAFFAHCLREPWEKSRVGRVTRLSPFPRGWDTDAQRGPPCSGSHS